MTPREIEKLFERAPEDATHYAPARGVFKALWAKLHDGAYQYMDPESKDPDWYGGQQPMYGEEFIARPTTPQWSGEGLPPVGAVCKIPDDMSAGNPFLEKFEGVTAHVIAHTEGATGNMHAVFWYENHDGSRRFHALAGDNGNFEPIRTVEQIAAEEREAAIDEMIDECKKRACSGDFELTSESVAKMMMRFFGTLHDAGYKKPNA